MERAYAQALWQIIEAGTEPSKAVHALHASLLASGRVNLMPRIGKAFERLAAHEASRTSVTLTVADKNHEQAALKEASSHIARFQLANKVMMTRVDKTVIGGWRLEGNETLVDASYKKHLLAIYKNAAQS